MTTHQRDYLERTILDPDNSVPTHKKLVVTEETLYEFLANFANLSRFSYSLQRIKIREQDNELEGNAFKIDDERDISVANSKVPRFFNQTLGRNFNTLIDNIELIHNYEIDGRGGTCFIGVFNECKSEVMTKDVNHLERLIIVGFRGTSTKDEWTNTNFKVSGIDYKPLNKTSDYAKDYENWWKDIKVHKGFYKALKGLATENKNKTSKAKSSKVVKGIIKHSTSGIRKSKRLIEAASNKELIEEELQKNPEYGIFKDLREVIENEEYQDYKLVITGHSLGGALAALLGIEAQALGWNPTVITLASPQVGFHKSGIKEKYLKFIYNHFDTTLEKYDIVQKGDVDEMLNPLDSFFINVVSGNDVVTKLPSGPFADLGGLTVNIGTKKSIDDETVDSQSLYLDPSEIKKFYKIKYGTEEKLKELSKASGWNEPLTLQLWETVGRSTFLETFSHSYKFVNDFIDFLISKNILGTGKFFTLGQAVTQILLNISQLVGGDFELHMFYLLYNLSYERDGIDNFPILLNDVMENQDTEMQT